MTPILAIDPGKNGGFAFQNNEGITVKPMPETEGDVIDYIRSITAFNPTVVCWIEKVGGFVGEGKKDGEGGGQPGSAMFKFGRGVGILVGALMAMGVPIKAEVPPQTWQKFHGVGHKGDRTKTEWKNHLKSKAQQLYPMLDITLKTADALLILSYAVNQERL